MTKYIFVTSGVEDAWSIEFSKTTAHPVIDLMPDYRAHPLFRDFIAAAELSGQR